jgi:hypothetical protein
MHISSQQDPDAAMTREDKPDPVTLPSCQRLTHVAVDDYDDPSVCIQKSPLEA